MSVLFGALLVPVVASGYGDPKRDPVAPTATRLAQTPTATAHIEVLLIEATRGDGGVSPTLADLPQLRQPPFDSFTQLTLVSRTTLPLAAAPSTANFPRGGSATVTLGGRSADNRYTVDVAFRQGAAGSNIQFVAAAAEPFFTVRSRRPDRALIFGFIVRP